jgi:GNAT superfamily N-acetyltransferase
VISETGAASVRDADLARRLVVHEALVHSVPGRELRDLGDAWILTDPADGEPFWNRVVGPRWPDDPAAFERRLDEIVTIFSVLGRLPHVRPLPIGGNPADLPDRLRAAGFRQVGLDRSMVLVDPEPCRVLARQVASTRRLESAGLRVERLPARSVAVGRAALDVAVVLAEAFAVEPGRRIALESDTLACAGREGCSVILLRERGIGVSAARRLTGGGGAYLSSIGTRPGWRGRGYGALVTAVAVADALEAGSEFVHLGVEAANDRARRLYERLGFATVGELVPDFLMR